MTADALIDALLRISETETVCILDSCGVGHLGSHLLISGVRPIEAVEVSDPNVDKTLNLLNTKLTGDVSCIFTLSYDFGVKLQSINASHDGHEPDAFLALFPAIVIHDYDSGRTFLTGDNECAEEIAALISKTASSPPPTPSSPTRPRIDIDSNLTKAAYIDAVEVIHEYIRDGDTYQTNLTQKLSCSLPADLTPQDIFRRLRREHPAPFAAFLQRKDSTVVSASPERFFRVGVDGRIESSPIKGTRRRGQTPDEDARLRTELRMSEKDRAENTMIVDLVRNDLGRICNYGSVEVLKLCDIEEHPTLFHLVSTVGGELKTDVRPSDILRAVFPCGSITGAPKIRTMQIIEELEPDDRGLSMGAIGVYLPDAGGFETRLDVSVAIRTMVIRNAQMEFNVGGGIVIDSDPEKEYEESLLKATVLLNAIGADRPKPR